MAYADMVANSLSGGFEITKEKPLVGLFALAAFVVGSFHIARFTMDYFRVFYNIHLRRGIKLERFGANQGAWALVTGCTDGIGREFAVQLAQRKFNVVLVSRTQSKLDAVASEIGQSSGMQTSVFALDFAKATVNDFLRLKAAIDPLDVRVLVNCAGVSHDMPTDFADESFDAMEQIVDVNIKGLLRTTKIALPNMISRKNGLILNVGSFSGLNPCPMLPVYGPAKSFVHMFSAALGSELDNSGIVVQNLNTYFVVSKISKIRRASWLIPTPKAYVQGVLDSIGNPGAASLPHSSSGYPSHGWANWVVQHAPTSLIVRYTKALHRDIRRRALRKREREVAASKAD